MSDEMSRLRLCEISDGGHFFVHDAEGNDLAKIEAKLKELKDKVGSTQRTNHTHPADCVRRGVLVEG